MEHNQTNLHNLLKEILGNDNVYFQAPSKMSYPCIKCDLGNIYTTKADNTLYQKMKRYTITVIHKNFNNDDITDKLLKVEYCSFDRRFISDGLYHDVFTLYY